MPSQVATLVRQLGDADPQVRKSAAAALALLGHEAREAVPALITALSDRKPPVRLAAVRALGALGLSAHEAGPILCDMLHTHRAEHARLALIEAIERVSTDPAHAIPSLLSLLAEGESQEIRQAVLRAIQALGPDAAEAAPWLWEQLKGVKCLFEGHQYSDALVGIGPGVVPLLPTLVKALGKPRTRDAAVRALRAVTPYADPALAVLPLAEALGKVKGDMGGMVLLAIHEAGPALTAIAPQLTRYEEQILQACEGPGWVVEHAVAILAHLDPTGERTDPRWQPGFSLALLEQNLGPDVRRQVWLSLPAPHPTACTVWERNRNPGCPERARARLGEAMDAGEKWVRERAITLAGELKATEHLERLRNLWKEDPELEVRQAAALSLFRITGDARPGLTLADEVFQRGDPFELNDTFEMLESLGPAAAELAPTLRDYLRRAIEDNEGTYEDRTWYCAASALASIAPPDRFLLGVLEQKMRESWDEQRALAVIIVGKIRKKTPALYKLLEKALNDESLGVRASAARAAGQGSSLPPRIIQRLLALLAEPSTKVYRPAAVSLLRLGKHVRQALAVLSAGWYEKPSLQYGLAEETECSGTSYLPIYLLSECDQDPRPILGALTAALGDRDESVRLFAAINLARWGELVPACVAIMTQCLSSDPDDGREFLRWQAAHLLGELGRDALPAQQPLEAIVPTIRTWRVRSEMKRTIARLQLLRHLL